MNNCEKKLKKKIEKNFNNNLSTNMNTKDAIQEQLQEQLNSCHLRYENNEIDRKVWGEEVIIIRQKMIEHLEEVCGKIKINFFDGSNMIYQCEETITYNKIIEYIKKEKGKDKYTMVKLFKMGEEEEIKMPSRGDELFCLFKEAEKIEWDHNYNNELLYTYQDFNLDRLYFMMLDFVKEKTEEFYLEDYEEYKGDSKKIMDNMGDNVGELFASSSLAFGAINKAIGKYDDFFSKEDEDGDECSMTEIIDQYNSLKEFCEQLGEGEGLALNCDALNGSIHRSEFYEIVCYCLCYVAIENLTIRLPLLGGFKKGLKFDNINFLYIQGSDEDYKSFNTMSIEFEEDVKDGEVMIRYNVIHDNEDASGGKRIKVYPPNPECNIEDNHIKLVISRYNLDTTNTYTINEIHITDKGEVKIVDGYDTDSDDMTDWDIRC